MKERVISLLIVLLCTVLLGVPLGGWKLFSSEVPPPSAEPRTYGATFDVPGFRWVAVMNEGGVNTESLHLPKYDECLMRYRGIVTEVTNFSSFYTWATGSVLAEYAPPQGARVTGTLCPEGTVFLIPPDQLQAFQQRYEARAAFEADLQADVSRLARNAAPDASEPVPDLFRWVEVANPEGVQTQGHDVEFLDICGIQSGGESAWLGQTFDGDVYAYRPPTDGGLQGVGIPCPDGTLYMNPPDELRLF